MEELNTVVAVVDIAPEIAPVVVANTSKMAMWGKKALEAAKTGGAMTAAGMVFGAQVVLFVGGAAAVIYGASKAVDFASSKYETYRAKKVMEVVDANAKKAVADEGAYGS